MLLGTLKYACNDQSAGRHRGAARHPRCLLLAAAAIFGLFPSSSPAQIQLPFLHPNDVILFQGDSITDGGRWRTGQDYNHIMGQDYAYMIAGELGAELAERNLTFLNRGIGGETVFDLAVRWKTDTLATQPNVLSILVGINDAFSPHAGSETVEEFESAYDHLLAQTTAALPGTRIILGEPFLLPIGKYEADYASQLKLVRRHQEVVRRLGAKYHLPVIPYQSVFDEACQRAPAAHWSWDGVHPTYAGHWLMAQAWLKTASAAWSR